MKMGDGHPLSGRRFVNGLRLSKSFFAAGRTDLTPIYFGFWCVIVTDGFQWILRYCQTHQVSSCLLNIPDNLIYLVVL